MKKIGFIIMVFILVLSPILAQEDFSLLFEDEEGLIFLAINEQEEAIDEDEETEILTYSQYSYSELKEMLDEAIRNENYEKASMIRDELQKRGK